MSGDAWQRAGALYVPAIIALGIGMLRGPRPRQFAACLLSVLWVLVSLPILQHINTAVGWWRFSSGGVLFVGMPLELYLGWVILWGVIPQLAFPKLPLYWCAVVMAVVDVVCMPLCKTSVHLGAQWLIGEVAAVLLVLMPALCVARWTLEDTKLSCRAALQVMTSGLLFLYLLPEIAFALRPGRGWEPLWVSRRQLQLEVQIVLLLAVPGVSAVMEFAQRGGGTPIPYDPPKRLVTSGIYRYIANPMQLSCGAVMLVWAGVLHNVWLALAALISVIYSAGLAEWDEAQDLKGRFGDEWTVYRATVRNWLPRWRPFHAGPPARLYIAGSCGPCSELRRWLESRRPLGMEFVAAETLPQGSIRRLRYDPRDGSACVEGIRAFGRALEHLQFGWALAGAVLRLPGVWQSIQLLMDASGLGPRVVVSEQSCKLRPE